MRISNRGLCLLALLILAVTVAAAPATVLAQSAGDDQYVDPFQGGGGGGGNGGGGGDNASQTGGSNDTGSAPAQTSPSDTAQDPAAESSDGTLPRTGFVLVPVALLGMFLLGSGTALRRGARTPDPAPARTRVVRSTPVARPAPALRPAPSRRPADVIAAEPDPPATSRSGVPAVGIGLVGLLLVLGSLLRRRG
jgi:hypothetical protein